MVYPHVISILTTPAPIETSQFPSNWELSAVRATTVLRHLVTGGDLDDLQQRSLTERVTATGYGSALPLVDNDSDENRAINRRTEFVLQRPAKP